MKLQKMLSLAATMIALPAIGFAEEAPKAVPTDMIWIMNTLLFLIGGFLVFFMAAGFAMLEAGLVRSKNCLLYTSPSPRDRTRSRMPSSA